jgi:heme/copper-type cytochrome/quinol oxidase subunit 2
VGVHDRTRESRSAWWLATALLASVVLGAGLVAQSKRDVTVSAKKYGFEPAEIRVQQDDLVTVVFTAEDIAHSFTISDDHYRIDRRAEPGKPASFKFRADKPGTFEIRCTLTIDDRCLREMRAKLVVVGK